MHVLITKRHKHLLYKDEIGEEFLLLKRCEVFERSETTLGCHFWLKPARSKVAFLSSRFNERVTDDPLYICDINKADLPALLALERSKRRKRLTDVWLKDMEKKLCHKIIPYNPRIER